MLPPAIRRVKQRSRARGRLWCRRCSFQSPRRPFPCLGSAGFEGSLPGLRLVRAVVATANRQCSRSTIASGVVFPGFPFSLFAPFFQLPLFLFLF